jgi:hypothetical protein
LRAKRSNPVSQMSLWIASSLIAKSDWPGHPSR